jgi:hypothetical protein
MEKAVVRNVSEEFDAAFGNRCEVRIKQRSKLALTG